MNKTFPLIIAHRGSSGEAPENTLKAFDLALKQGADGIELDIFLTRDKKIVVTHDENAKRLAGVDRWVRKSTFRELRELDYGSGEKLPTLDEVFDLCAQKLQIINIEIKSTGFFTDGIEADLVKLIKKRNLIDRVIVSSFNPVNLFRLKTIAPEIRRGYLFWEENWWNRQPFSIKMCAPQSMNLYCNWINEERMAYFAGFAPEIWLWTVNNLEDMKRWILEPRVKAIITNYPERLNGLLER